MEGVRLTCLPKELDISAVSQADPAARREAPSVSRSADVARDLEAIFAPLPHGAPGRPEGIPAEKGLVTVAPQAPLRRKGTFLGLILVMLFCLAAVALASWWLAAPAPIVAQSAAPAARTQPPAPAPQSNPHPDLADIGTAPALDDIPDAPPIPLAQDRAFGSRPAVTRLTMSAPLARPDRGTPPTASSPAPADAQPVASAPPSMAAAAPVAPAPELARACEPGATESWCLRTPVTEADAALRDAYAAAVSAGVKRSVLGEIRADWSRLRRNALSDPQTVLRGYAALTEQLRLEARQAQP